MTDREEMRRELWRRYRERQAAWQRNREKPPITIPTTPPTMRFRKTGKPSYRRDRPLGERNWPTKINGHPARPRRGTCPGCSAPEDRWCSASCRYIDPMDYR